MRSGTMSRHAVPSLVPGLLMPVPAPVGPGGRGSAGTKFATAGVSRATRGRIRSDGPRQRDRRSRPGPRSRATTKTL
jgi:hypothetical protein